MITKKIGIIGCGNMEELSFTEPWKAELSPVSRHMSMTSTPP